MVVKQRPFHHVAGMRSRAANCVIDDVNDRLRRLPTAADRRALLRQHVVNVFPSVRFTYFRRGRVPQFVNLFGISLKLKHAISFTYL